MQPTLSPALPRSQDPARTLRWQVRALGSAGAGLPELGAQDLHLWLVRRELRSAAGIIARYAGIDPERLEVEIGPYGKPHIAGSSLAFNISHSGSYTLVGLAWNARLGVDLELSRKVSRRNALLQRCFSAAERQRMETSDEDALLRYWAAKEAVVKAIGRGIAYGLAQIEIDEVARGALHLVQLGGAAGPASAWRLMSGRVAIDGIDGYVAVAHDGPPRTPLCCIDDGLAV